MGKKILLLGIIVLLVYMTYIDPVTSSIIFSKRTLLSKGLALGKYLLVSGIKLLWKFLCALVSLGGDLWDAFFGQHVPPSYDIRDFQDLYHLYQQVEAWSGLPWQIFWGIHAEETSLGRNLGSTQVLSVLPQQQKPFFDRMCRELQWDPGRVYGSHKGAIGPFQFIPETWMRNAVDANGDGRKDPFDVEDAAYSAANYLMRKGGRENLRKAIWHYNQDPNYVRRVMRYLQYS